MEFQFVEDDDDYEIPDEELKIHSAKYNQVMKELTERA